MEQQLKELHQCLDKAGYVPGNEKMFIIAMLGAIGESGEVVEEYLKQFHPTDITNSYTFRTMDVAAKECRSADTLKKRVRDSEFLTVPPVNEFNLYDETKLDAEIADQLYYLVALMKCRNKPVDQYLQMSVDKFNSRSKKQATK